MIENYLFTFLISAIGAGIGAYLVQKFKNVATKEDIAEITKNQKEVEHVINQKFNNEQAILEEQRKVIINFYNQVYIYKNHIVTLGLNVLLKYREFEENINDFNSIRKEFSNVLLASANINLMIRNEDILKLVNLIIEIQDCYIDMFLEFIYTQNEIGNKQEEISKINILRDKFVKKRDAINFRLDFVLQQYLVYSKSILNYNK